MARRKKREPVLKTGTRIIGIVSGKGGVGKTTVSANLAIALKALGQKVVVIDCNVTTPHLRYYMGVEDYSTTINNVFSGDVDVKHAPLCRNGVMFIPASEKFVDLESVDMRNLKGIIYNLANQGNFDYIILDSAPGLGREGMGSLQACNEIIFLTTPTAPNIRDIARCKEVARIIGHKKFGMVLNMVRGKDYEITPDKAERLFGIPVIGSIPFDENIMDSTAQGTPIMWYKPNSKSCDHFLKIAENISGVDRDEQRRTEEEWEEIQYRNKGVIPIVRKPMGPTRSEGRSIKFKTEKLKSGIDKVKNKITDVFENLGS